MRQDITLGSGHQSACAKMQQQPSQPFICIPRRFFLPKPMAPLTGVTEIPPFGFWPGTQVLVAELPQNRVRGPIKLPGKPAKAQEPAPTDAWLRFA